MNWIIGLGLLAAIIGGVYAFTHDNDDNNDGYSF